MTKTRFELVSPVITIRSRSESRDEGYKDRRAVVVQVGPGLRVSFYESTGTGTPGRVEAGEWTPFNGISRRMGGWFIKAHGKKAQGVLAEVSQWLSNL